MTESAKPLLPPLSSSLRDHLHVIQSKNDAPLSTSHTSACVPIGYDREASLGSDDSQQSAENAARGRAHGIATAARLWWADVAETAAYSRHRLAQLRAVDCVLFAVFLLLVAATQAMMFFGQNFWLSSFDAESSGGGGSGGNAFATVLLPAVAWAVLIAVIAAVYTAVAAWRRPAGASSVSLLFWWGHREGTALLVLVGVLDAFAGLTSTYAVPHVPSVVQTAMYATGTVWVYVFHRLAYRRTALPASAPLILSFALVLASVAFAIIPQAQQASAGGHSYIHPGWLAVLACSVVLPAGYNVIQGRFLSLFPPEATGVPAEASKLVSLFGDFAVQLVVTVALLPVGAVPWFGGSSTVDGVWAGVVGSARCLGRCPHNATYFTVYVLGFLGTRIVGAKLNLYSPTMASLIFAVVSPLNVFMLALFPALNVYGAPIDAAYTVGSFVCMAASAAVYCAANEASKDRAAFRAMRATMQGTHQKHCRLRITITADTLLQGDRRRAPHGQGDSW